MKFNLVFCVPGMPFEGNTLETQSLGGSETAGLSMAKEMAKRGHMVRMFCGTTGISKCADGVEYLPLSYFNSFAGSTPHDVCIVQRTPEIFGSHFASKLNVLWAHDMALLRNSAMLRRSLWNVDKVMTVSRFHTDNYKQVYGLPEDLFYTSRNGVDLSMTPELKPRNHKLMVYAARPERGLDVMLESILPKILEREPDARLIVCGYDNTVPQMVPFYEHLKGLVAKFPLNATWAGHLTKAQLYDLYVSAGVYVYPTPSPKAKDFREVSCISAMEAQMCGLPMVTSNAGALLETLSPEAGVLFEGDPWTPDYQNRFVDEVVLLMSGGDKWAQMSAAGRTRAAQLSWASLAEEWECFFTEQILKNNNNPERLARHLLRHSDVIVASGIAKEEGFMPLQKEIDAGWGFIGDKESVREQYEKIGQTHTDVFEASAYEPRYKLLVEKLKEESGIKRVLDFGCAHGSYAGNLSNRYPELEILGVDVDKYSIEWAERNRDTRVTNKENLSYMIGDADIDLSAVVEKGGLFDALIAFEVLEHTDEPWAMVDKLERWVRPGGKILITTPYGPWEEDSYHTYPHRCHVWELGFDELREMFGKKKCVSIESVYQGHSQVQDAPLGFNMTIYTKSDAPTGTVNVERKKQVQRPRQTVSLSMICGQGAEETLGWALDSVKTVADETVIADCGMSEAALAIAYAYGAKIIQGMNPREVGFDEARNLTLPYCTMDWVLWMDSDERLTDPQRIHKYLRENIYHGYSIRQHHFAVDTAFSPDLPVRLFRNRPCDGKTVKFYGSCHEHPEIGLNEGIGQVIVLSDVNIAHVGYLAESGRKRRFFRNFPLMQMSLRKYPDRLLNKYFVMRDNTILNGYEMQQTGGVITESVRTRAQEVIDLYRAHFCGKGTYMGADSTEYYSQACKTLGLGAEVAFCVNSAESGVPHPEVKVYRFATTSDLQAELSRRAHDALDSYCSPAW